MSMTKIEPLCGSCKCNVVSPPNPKPDDQVACPSCGRTDRFDKVVETVGEHITYLTTQAMAKDFAKSTRRDSFIQFSIEKPQNRSFRWISNYKG